MASISNPSSTTATSSTGTSVSNSPPLLQTSGSEGDLQLVMDQRKQKRMLSNRESARRSRLRKQKHLDDLMAQVDHLRKENNQIMLRLNITNQHYQNIEAENFALRAQMEELSSKLQLYTEMLQYIEDVSGLAMDIPQIPDPLLKPWHLPCMAQQPIMASAMFQY